MDLDALAQQGRLDQRCLDCGATEAFGAWCSRCSSTNIEPVPHRSGEPCLASGRRGNAASLRIGTSTGAEAPEALADVSEPVQIAAGL